MSINSKWPVFIALGLLIGCQSLPSDVPYASVSARVVTEPVKWDTDDPAIWINRADPANSLVIGTDKNSDGALYAFNLKGKIVKRVGGLKRPNNVDIAYGFLVNGQRIDIAVVTEREAQRLRIFELPSLAIVDKGDLVVFHGDKERAPMGIAMYKRPADSTFFAFVGGKSGPPNGYIGQYRLWSDSSGIRMDSVREFGRYSGKAEIESIAVDAELGYVYYSDEGVGVRKYYADPDSHPSDPDEELAMIATEGFAGDHEGISIYKTSDTTGYILVSDQQANRFWIFPREGSAGKPHDHRVLKIISVSTEESDGSDVTSFPFPPDYPSGLFVAMSNGKTFHYFSWEDIAGKDLDKGFSR